MSAHCSKVDTEFDYEKRLLQLRSQRNALNLEIERLIEEWVKSLQNGDVS